MRNKICNTDPTKSPLKKFKKCILSLLLATTAVAPATAAKLAMEDSGPISPMLILSDKVGDVGMEALGLGVPPLFDSDQASVGSDIILYVDIDTIKVSDKINIFNTVRKAVLAGGIAVVETSQFDFNRMHTTIFESFPDLDKKSIQDVAVMLYLEKGRIKAIQVDPSELAVYAGIPRQKTTSFYIEELVKNKQTNLDSNKSLSTSLKQMLRFATKAYESTPTDGEFNLKYNGTYVDVWKSKDSSKCMVAWRGTVITNLTDLYADLRSQLSWSAKKIDNDLTSTMEGGKGFVNRLHAYDDDVAETLHTHGCNSIDITGHSLGGAVAQLHTLQLYNKYWFSGRVKSIATWNSPNSVTPATRSTWYDDIDIAYNYHSMCRTYDMLVNPVPTGLKRLGPNDSSPVGCTYVGAGTYTSWNLSLNHNIGLWWNDF